MSDNQNAGLGDVWDWSVPTTARVDHVWMRRVSAAVARVHQYAPAESVILLRCNPRVCMKMLLTMDEEPILEPAGVSIHLKEDQTLDDYRVVVQTREPSAFDHWVVVHDAPGLTEGQLEAYAQFLKDGVPRLKAIELASVIR